MTLKEAIDSGRKVKRPSWKRFHDIEGRVSLADAIAEDWLVEEPQPVDFVTMVRLLESSFGGRKKALREGDRTVVVSGTPLHWWPSGDTYPVDGRDVDAKWIVEEIRG